jgi:alkylation response protein AidB-like acyl-CoA dehydrogenase
MVLEYLSLARPGTPPREVALGALLRVQRCGSTGLAAAMAHHVSGTPLPVEARRERGGLVLDGRVRWASNLFAGGFVLVTAARAAEGPPLIVALAAGSPGLRVDPYPELLALQATASSSLVLEGARVDEDAVVSDDFGAFIARVRPVFLVLQAAFCWGLARRALDEARGAMSGQSEVLLPELAEAEERAAEQADELHRAARAGPATVRIRELVRLRLEAARLATAAVALEARAVGSRGYARGSGTARRLREAAFLPIQAPTEVQLRAELAGGEVLAEAR